ncbi:uncharacterized protein LOC123035786 [Varanus komodoensis]|uniref:uncharacterized protein LOC123035786 n=1 Tax=Varanus komodoensis TaxID=61221 RepID=UPI001CF78373|nr:uncharacterized protein LOC123035786 [Varanus komodoensis]
MDDYAPYGYYPSVRQCTLSPIPRDAPSTSAAVQTRRPSLLADSRSSPLLHYDLESEDSDVASTSPDTVITTQGPSSPEELYSTFGELMARLARSLEIETQYHFDPSTNKFYNIVKREQSSTIILPLITTLKVYIATISHYCGQVAGLLVFSNILIRRFLRGLQNLQPPVRSIVLMWSLSVVFPALTKPPFEPLATTNLHLLSWKTAFLVAVTSARRASELFALHIDPPYLNLHKEKVVLRTDRVFLPKVMSPFHVTQDIVLPAFFPTPSMPMERSLHSLDVRRCLTSYRSCTESFRNTRRLFIKYSERDKGFPIGFQRLSKWIVQTIELAYQLSKLDLPVMPRGHSMRAVAASSAFSTGIPLHDIARRPLGLPFAHLSDITALIYVPDRIVPLVAQSFLLFFSDDTIPPPGLVSLLITHMCDAQRPR